jgi:hypothetical protein
MASHRIASRKEADRSPLVGLLTTLVILVLTLALFLLGKSMIAHHFFSGERQ